MLARSDHDLPGSHKDPDGKESSQANPGAQGHCSLSGPVAEGLAQRWGLEMVPEEYFWTRRRWDEHMRGLLDSNDADNYDLRGEFRDQALKLWTDKVRGSETANLLAAQEGWDGQSYLPQGTVGCVCLDRDGLLCVATSTGGLTNKLDGRIGDTPTAGAGYWASEWTDIRRANFLDPPWWVRFGLVREVRDMVRLCLPISETYGGLRKDDCTFFSERTRAVAMSGTGNGDSFLRLAACRTAAAIAQYSPNSSLACAVRQVAGPGGELQHSAMDRWGKTGEGEAGIIGIEFVNGDGLVVWDFNCGGMYRCWVDDSGRDRIMVFRDEYPGVGMT